MSQLRQTKTKFHDASTYYMYLCRASSHFARHQPCQPSTIFSLASIGPLEASDKAAMASLFDAIAPNVMKLGRKAVLDKEALKHLQSRCNKRGSAFKAFEQIRALFPSRITFLPFLDNKDPNGPLESMALILSAYVSKSNAAVVNFINNEFASFTM